MDDDIETKGQVPLSNQQLEIMRNEIGEILGRLKEKNVYDLKEKIPVVLINRGSINPEFKRTEILKVKNFVTVVNQSLRGFSYLVRNPNFTTITTDVERSDYISGAIDYRKTTLLRQHTNSDNANKVACKVIQRDYDTVENRLLAIVLFSIIIYCDKYLSLDSSLVLTKDRLTKDRFEPTLGELRSIRETVATLLSSRRIKEILSTAISSSSIPVDNLFGLMLRRIQQGKTPEFFIMIFNLFCKLKEYVKASEDDVVMSKHVLQYYLLSISNPNDLYECWVLCKVLDAIANTYKDLTFRESHSSKGVMTLDSEDGLIKVTYQPSYDTIWEYKDGYIQDNPDIAIEAQNGVAIIVDAKNSQYSKTFDPHPNRTQMDSYIRYTGARCGIFVHSRSENPEVWEERPSKKNNKAIIWTCLIPDHSLNKQNNNNIQRIIDQVRSTSTS